MREKHSELDAFRKMGDMLTGMLYEKDKHLFPGRFVAKEDGAVQCLRKGR